MESPVQRDAKNGDVQLLQVGQSPRVSRSILRGTESGQPSRRSSPRQSLAVNYQIDDESPSKRSSVSFIDLPSLQRNGSDNGCASGEDIARALKKRKSLGSVKSLASVATVLPTGTTYHHWIAFLLTYCSYMLFHSMRKTLSTVKASMVNTWMVQNISSETLDYDHSVWHSHHLFNHVSQAQDFLGILDAVFMFTYAAGLYICGILGDRFDPRIVLVIGMCGTAIMNFIFGCMTEWMEFYSIPLYVLLWIANGLMQGTGFPMVVSVMGNWFGHGGRGLVLGFWSSCQSVGNVLGAYIAMAVLEFGYEYAFLVNATLLFAAGVIVFFALIPAPRDLSLPDPLEKHSDDQSRPMDDSCSVISERPKPVTFLQALLLPGVIAYALSYACLKLVNYSVFFWLPYYLNNNFGWKDTEAAAMSSYYDWGGVIGGTIGGIISDALGKRTPVVSAQMLFAIAAFGVYSISPNNRVINGILMGIVGFFVGGAANLISAAVSADLGRQEAVRNSAEALSTVSGIIDGTGSAGAAFGQIVIPLLQNWFGWNSIFYMFMVMLLVASLLLCKLCYRETKAMCQDIRARCKGKGETGQENHNTKIDVNVTDEDSK